MKTLLITGGAGFIGSNFVDLCAQNGVKSIVLDKLTYAGHRANLAHLSTQSHELIQGDIADGTLVARLLREHNADALVNFAAESHVDNSISGPAPFIETNIVGTYQLLQAALEYWREKPPFRFVHISTDEVYGSLGPQGHFTEASPMLPNSPYSASKAAADHLARAWHKTYGLPVITTHCSNNYGPRQYPEKLIPHMIRCALAEKPLPVYGDGMNVRDWIHVADHCEGLWLALTRGAPGEVYNFGGNAEVDNLTLVRKICALLDERRPRAGRRPYSELISFVTDRPGHDRRYAIDDHKAVSNLGFGRAYDFEHGLAATVDWYLSHQDWCETVTRKERSAA